MPLLDLKEGKDKVGYASFKYRFLSHCFRSMRLECQNKYFLVLTSSSVNKSIISCISLFLQDQQALIWDIHHLTLCQIIRCWLYVWVLLASARIIALMPFQLDSRALDKGILQRSKRNHPHTFGRTLPAIKKTVVPMNVKFCGVTETLLNVLEMLKLLT